MVLAKATPGYVGADLAALTGAAGLVAVKRLFKEISDGTLTLPEDIISPTDGDASMAVDPPLQPPSTTP